MFSLRTLFIFVAFAAIACAALVYRTPFWGSAIITCTLAVAVGATIVAWRAPDRRSLFVPWAGVMWLYLLIIFFTPLNELERQLVTNHLVYAWWSSIAEPVYPIANIDEQAYWAEFHTVVIKQEPNILQRERPTLDSLKAFYYTVHCVVSVLLGGVAGLTTAFVYGRGVSQTLHP